MLDPGSASREGISRRSPRARGASWRPRVCKGGVSCAPFECLRARQAGTPVNARTTGDYPTRAEAACEEARLQLPTKRRRCCQPRAASFSRLLFREVLLATSSFVRNVHELFQSDGAATPGSNRQAGLSGDTHRSGRAPAPRLCGSGDKHNTQANGGDGRHARAPVQCFRGGCHRRCCQPVRPPCVPPQEWQLEGERFCNQKCVALSSAESPVVLPGPGTWCPTAAACPTSPPPPLLPAVPFRGPV